MNTYLDLFLIASALFIGSFITATANAWPKWGAVLVRRSGCGECGRTLTIRELIPVISYFAQKRHCACGKVEIWSGHPFGEAAALSIAVSAVLVSTGVATVSAIFLGWVLLFGALVDARTGLLPDVVTLGLIPVGLGVSFYLGGTVGLWAACLGAVIGFSALFLIATIYKHVRGREGIGMGDAKLLAAGGAWCGVMALPWIVAIGAGATLVYVAIRSFGGAKISGKTAIPFGPGLSLGVFTAHLLSQQTFATGY